MKPLNYEQALSNALNISSISPELSNIVVNELKSVQLIKKQVKSWTKNIDSNAGEVERWLLIYKDQLKSDNYIGSIQEHFASEIKKPRKIQTALIEPSRHDGDNLNSKRKTVIGRHDAGYFDALLNNAPNTDDVDKSSSADYLFIGIEALAAFLNTFNYFDGCQSISIPSSITLVESRPEAFAFAAYLIDYSQFFDLAKERKVFIKIVLRDSPEFAFNEYLAHSIYAIPAAFYRTIVFTSPDLDQTLLAFTDKIFSRESLHSRLLSKLGDSGDEINQLQQYCQNLFTRKTIKTLDFNSKPDKLLKDIHDLSILVGSGPSLDESLSTIQNLESSHIIFCAGSSIRTLLKANINPDFLVLLERGAALYDDLLSLNQEGYDFSGITLIASLSVDSRIPFMFKDVIFFNREPNSPTELIGLDPCCSLPCAGPESLNAAVEIIALIGFKTVYGFGVDFGSATRQYTRSKEAMGNYQRQFDKPVMGSNKKTFFTSSALEYSREIFDLTLREYPGTKFVRNAVGLPLNHALMEPFQYNLPDKRSDFVDLIPVKTLSVDVERLEMTIERLNRSRVDLISFAMKFRELYLASVNWTSELHKSFALLLWPAEGTSIEYVGATKVIRSYAFYAGQYIRFLVDQPHLAKVDAVDWYLDSVIELYSFGVDATMQQILPFSFALQNASSMR